MHYTVKTSCVTKSNLVCIMHKVATEYMYVHSRKHNVLSLNMQLFMTSESNFYNKSTDINLPIVTNTLCNTSVYVTNCIITRHAYLMYIYIYIQKWFTCQSINFDILNVNSMHCYGMHVTHISVHNGLHITDYTVVYSTIVW